jgi:hypothetical protein
MSGTPTKLGDASINSLNATGAAANPMPFEIQAEVRQPEKSFRWSLLGVHDNSARGAEGI